MRRLLAFLLLAFVIALLPAAALAQVSLLVPEVAKMPPPDWVKPGVRVTWYASSSTKQEDYATRAGPGEGNLRDDEGGRAQRQKGHGVGGMGYMELFVVGVAPGKIVYETRFYLLVDAKFDGRIAMRIISGAVSTTPGAVDDYWVHPAALEKLRKDGFAGYQIAVAPHPVTGEGKTALWIATGDEKMKMSWAYDLRTGILLSKGESYEGRRGIGGVTREGTDLTGRSRASGYMEFKESANLDLPWLGQANPDWVASTRRIEFDGSVQLTHPELRSLPPTPLSQRFERLEHGPTWGVFRHTTVAAPRPMLDGGTFMGMPVLPAKQTFVSGAGSLSGLWIPPATVGRLAKGQVLAKNAVTRFTTSVFYVGPDRGTDVCVIRWQNPSQILDYVYDRKSGGLLRVVNSDQAAQRQIVGAFAGAE